MFCSRFTAEWLQNNHWCWHFVGGRYLLVFFFSWKLHINEPPVKHRECPPLHTHTHTHASFCGDYCASVTLTARLLCSSIVLYKSSNFSSKCFLRTALFALNVGVRRPFSTEKSSEWRTIAFTWKDLRISDPDIEICTRHASGFDPQRRGIC